MLYREDSIGILPAQPEHKNSGPKNEPESERAGQKVRAVPATDIVAAEDTADTAAGTVEAAEDIAADTAEDIVAGAPAAGTAAVGDIAEDTAEASAADTATVQPARAAPWRPTRRNRKSPAGRWPDER